MNDIDYALGLLQFNSTPFHKQGVVHNPRGKIPRMPDIEGKQRCYVCKETKSLLEFSADRSRPNGRMSRCIICNNKRVRERAKTPKGRAWHRRYQLVHAYGITVEKYEEMVRNQNGVCSICKRSPRETSRHQFYVDHDHATGEARGLLCGPCNSAIGSLQENLEIVVAAYKYLEQWENNKKEKGICPPNDYIHNKWLERGKIIMGDTKEFMTEKVLDRERIEELKGKIMSAIDFLPNAKLSFAVESAVGGGYGVNYWTAAFSELLAEKLVGEKDGWLFKRRPSPA